MFSKTSENIVEMGSCSPEHQAKKMKLNEDSISKLSSSVDDHVPVSDSSSDDDDDIDLNLNKLKLKVFLSSLSSAYTKPLYPLTFIPNMSISDYVVQYSSFDDLVPAAAEVSLAGLRMKKLTLSESTFIYKLHSLERKAKAHVQVIAKARNSYMDDAEFSRFHSSLKPGLILGVSGLPVNSENGDPAICPSSYIVLTKEPKKQLPLDPDLDTCVDLRETLSLKRYQDIMMDKDVAPIFRLRYEIVDYITSFLEGHIFFKGGTPLNIVPEQSFANECIAYFHSCPFLLIWSQRMSCGHDYAYELGQKINEGIDLSQITKLIPFELCIDFDLNDLMTLTERILSEMVKDLIGVYKIKCHANGLNTDPIEIDFNPPFRKIDIMEELDKLDNLEKPEKFSSDATNKYLTGACTKYGIKCPPVQTNEELLDKVVKHFLEKCVNPTFILHPNIVSPPGKCGFTRHFELFVNKHEIFNGYAALENRFAQIQRIWNIKDRPLTESEEIALEHGVIKTGGWSLGIDRLTLLLTDAEHIE